MPRRSSIRYYASRKAYYTQIHGKQVLLASGPEDYPAGPTYLSALEAFTAIMSQVEAPRKGDRNNLRTLCNLFLANQEGRIQPATFASYLTMLRPLIAAYGDTLVCHFGPAKVETFLRQQRQLRADPRGRRRRWASTTVSLFLTVLRRVFRWAIESRLIDHSPMAGYVDPPAGVSVPKRLVSPEAHAKLLAVCRGRWEPLRPALMVLEATGARLGEVVAMQARYWNPQRRAFCYLRHSLLQPGDFRHKAAKHKDRWLYLSGDALACVQVLLAAHPRGALLRRRDGKPLTARTVRQALRTLCKRAGIAAITSHCYRHTFITNWLAINPNIDILSQLVGDEPETIRKRYSHLCDRWEAIRLNLEAFRSSPLSIAAALPSEPNPPDAKPVDACPDAPLQ